MYKRQEYPFIPKDENNNPIVGIEAFRPLSVSADLAYSYRIGRYLGLSVTARYIRSSYGELFTNNALGFDVAAYARIPLNRMLEGAWVSAGAKISDFGFTFDDSNYDLPTKFSVGGSLFAPIRDSHSLEASVDLGYRYSSSENKSFGMGIGVEYVLMQMIAVRGGYHVADSHGYDYGTIGAGLRFMHLELDFSYLFAAKKCPWRNTYQVGVGLYF